MHSSYTKYVVWSADEDPCIITVDENMPHGIEKAIAGQVFDEEDGAILFTEEDELPPEDGIDFRACPVSWDFCEDDLNVWNHKAGFVVTYWGAEEYDGEECRSRRKYERALSLNQKRKQTK